MSDLEFVIDENFKNAIRSISPFTSTSDNELAFIYVSVDNDIATITVGDETTKVKAYLPVVNKSGNSGNILIPSRFVDVLDTLPDTIAVKYNDSKRSLRISVSGRSTNLKCLNSYDYPRIDDDFVDVFSIDAEYLTRSLELVSKSSDNKNERPIYNGVNFKVNDDLTLAATDQFKLSAYFNIPFAKKVDDNEYDYTLRTSDLSRCMKLFDTLSNVNVIDVSVGDNFVKFSSDYIEIWLMKITGKFPQYADKFPTEVSLVTRFNINKLLFSIKSAMVFSDHVEIDCVVNDKVMKVSAYSEIGEHTDDVSMVDYNGSDISVVLKANFYNHLVSLKRIGVETIEMLFVNDNAPIMLREDGIDDHITMLVPVNNLTRLQQSS